MLHVIIVDEDEQYVRLLAAYIRGGEFANKVSLVSFTQREPFLQHVDHIKGGHALYLIHESLASYLNLEAIQEQIVWLGEHNVEEEGAVVRMNKYQPLNQLFSRLIVLQEERLGLCKESKVDMNRCKSIAVFSGTGGAGKTTAALNMAQQFANQGRNVFLLNLELFSSLPTFFQPDGTDRFSQLLYFARTKPDQLEKKMEQLKQYDSATKINYISPPSNVREMIEMTASDVNAILSSLTRPSAYDIVVVDLQTTLHERIWSALKACDQILWLLVDEVICQQKTAAVWSEIIRREQQEQVQLRGKTTFVLNKHKGTNDRYFDETIPGFSVSAHLPYIPEWKSVLSGEQLLTSPVYNNSLQKIIHHYTDKGVDPSIDHNRAGARS